jgi:3',5'-cyclic AMP phosphodiesterase CpdA
MWRHFDLQIRGSLRQAGIPLIATLGNHDASAYPAHERDRRIAVEYWRARDRPPGLVDGAEYPLRYTVRHGDVFFAVWDGTNQESARDPALLGWLRRALQSPEARSAAHVAVVSHLPLYPVAQGRDRPGEFLANGDSLARELERLGATLFVSGHHHAFYPGRRGALDLLHSGALGSGPRPLIGGDEPRRSVALLEFAADSLRIRAFEVLDGGDLRPVRIATLPAVICSGTHRVVRRDLVDADPPCASPDPPAYAGGSTIAPRRAPGSR